MGADSWRLCADRAPKLGSQAIQDKRPTWMGTEGPLGFLVTW